MKKLILSLTVAGVLGLSACSSGSSDVVVKSNAGNVTKDELYQSMKDKVGKQTLQQLVYEKVLSKKYKVTDKEVTAKIDELKKQFGANFEMVLMQNQIKDEKELKQIVKFQMLQEKAVDKDIKVTDKEVKEAYKQIKARHILVKDEKTALDIKKKLDAGGKFDELAKQNSTDTGTAQNGGDLGWFGPGKMVPEFDKVAFSLKTNEISAPVKSKFGYHIIQVTEKRSDKPFDKIKGDLEKELKQAKITPELLQKAMDRELKAAKVEVEDKDLKDTFETPKTSK